MRPVHLLVSLLLVGCTGPRAPVAQPRPAAGSAHIVWIPARRDVTRVVVALDGAVIHHGAAPVTPIALQLATGDHYVQTLVDAEMRSGLLGGVCKVRIKAGHPFVDDGSGTVLRIGLDERDATVPWGERFRVSFTDSVASGSQAERASAVGDSTMFFPMQLVTTDGCDPVRGVDDRTVDSSAWGPPLFGR